jgi:nucleotide-binding universal stress UspA family protein
MTYATLMVLLQLGQANANLLQVAGDLAERFHACIIGVAACRPLQVVCRESPVPAQLFEEDRKEFDRALRAAEVEFRMALQRRASRLEWRPRVTVLPLSDYLAGEARGAHLVVTGSDRNAPPFDPTRQVDTSDLVLQTGRPVLVVPAAVVKASFDRVHGAEPGADAAAWLSRHGVKVTVQRDVVPDSDVGGVILSRAADRGADLIVMGIYGHSRMREMVLGGASRTLLGSMTVPVFMAH